jgi:hypothetical protein
MRPSPKGQQGEAQVLIFPWMNLKTARKMLDTVRSFAPFLLITFGLAWGILGLQEFWGQYTHL